MHNMYAATTGALHTKALIHCLSSSILRLWRTSFTACTVRQTGFSNNNVRTHVDTYVLQLGIATIQCSWLICLLIITTHLCKEGLSLFLVLSFKGDRLRAFSTRGALVEGAWGVARPWSDWRISSGEVETKQQQQQQQDNKNQLSEVQNVPIHAHVYIAQMNINFCISTHSIHTYISRASAAIKSSILRSSYWCCKCNHT